MVMVVGGKITDVRSQLTENVVSCFWASHFAAKIVGDFGAEFPEAATFVIETESSVWTWVK